MEPSARPSVRNDIVLATGLALLVVLASGAGAWVYFHAAWEASPKDLEKAWASLGQTLCEDASQARFRISATLGSNDPVHTLLEWDGPEQRSKLTILGGHGPGSRILVEQNRMHVRGEASEADGSSSAFQGIDADPATGVASPEIFCGHTLSSPQAPYVSVERDDLAGRDATRFTVQLTEQSLWSERITNEDRFWVDREGRIVKLDRTEVSTGRLVWTMEVSWDTPTLVDDRPSSAARAPPSMGFATTSYTGGLAELYEDTTGAELANETVGHDDVLFERTVWGKWEAPLSDVEFHLMQKGAAQAEDVSEPPETSVLARLRLEKQPPTDVGPTVRTSGGATIDTSTMSPGSYVVVTIGRPSGTTYKATHGNYTLVYTDVDHDGLFSDDDWISLTGPPMPEDGVEANGTEPSSPSEVYFVAYDLWSQAYVHDWLDVS